MKEKNRSKKNSLVEKAITMSSNLDKLTDRITFISKWLKVLSQFIYAAVFTIIVIVIAHDSSLAIIALFLLIFGLLFQVISDKILKAIPYIETNIDILTSYIENYKSE